MSTLKEQLEAKIGVPAFGGSWSTPPNISDPHIVSSIREWLVLNGIPRREAQKARTESLSRAYTSKPYLTAWRNRVNPKWLGSNDDLKLDDFFNDPPKAVPATEPKDHLCSSCDQHTLQENGICWNPNCSSNAHSPPTRTQPTQADINQIADNLAGIIRPILDENNLALRAEQTMFLENHKKQSSVELAALFQKLIKDDSTKTQIRSIVNDAVELALRANLKHEIVLSDPKLETKTNLGLQHFLFPKLLKIANSRNHKGFRPNIWITGPTGGGKTTAFEAVARALWSAHAPDTDLLAKYNLRGEDLPPPNQPFGADSSLDADYKITGFKDANGNFHWTTFLKCFVFGYPYCADEIDNWSPSASLSLNAALAQGWMNTPIGILNRHPQFLIVACANTWGYGATNEYVGRNPLDAAFINRFLPKLDWPYDETLERQLCSNTKWCETVQSMRRKAKDLQGLQIIISPRDSFEGAALVSQGFSFRETALMTFAAGLSPEQQTALGVDKLSDVHPLNDEDLQNAS